MEALTKLRAASKDFAEGRDEQERRREILAKAIEDALRAKIGPSEIERETPYDRTHIDRIRKAAGIPATRRPTVRRVEKEE